MRPTLSPAHHEAGPVKRVVWLFMKAEFIKTPDTMERPKKGGWKEDGGELSPPV